MRATLLVPSVLLAAAGCLSAPTGRDPGTIDASDADADADVDGANLTWPPTAADVAAIATGDVDGDGTDDLVVADAANGRVFLLRGGVDVVPSRASVTTVSASAPLAGLRAPVAMTVATHQGARFVVVLDSPAAGARLTVFDDQLAQVSQVDAGAPPAAAGATVTLSQTTFGMSGNAVMGSVPDAVFFFEGSALPTASPLVLQVSDAGANPFAAVRVVGGYVVPGGPPTPRVFVSEETIAQRADVNMGSFTWTAARPSGASWSAQAVADVTGDDFPDVVGFAPDGANPADLCVLDVQGATAPGCYDTPFGMDTAMIAVGPIVAEDQLDVVIVNEHPQQQTMAAVFLVTNLRVAGTVMADGQTSPSMFPVDDALLALAQLDDGVLEILVVGKDGAIACARSSGQAPVRCDQ